VNDIQRAMTPEEREEYAQILKEATSTGSTGAQASRLQCLLVDADQAGRRWARWLLDGYQHQGAMKDIRSYHKRLREAVSWNGTTVLKPRAGAVTTEAGFQQKLFRFMTQTELVEHRRMISQQQTAASQTIEQINRYLELLSQAPSAETPDVAARVLGVDIEQWLAS